MCKETDRIERVKKEMHIETQNIKSLIEAFSSEIDILSKIWDLVPQLMFFKDDKNNIIKVNSTFAKYAGLKKEDIEGKHVSELMKNNIGVAKYASNDSIVFKTKKPIYNIKEKLFDTDIDLRTDKVPIIEDGKVIGIWGSSIIL